MMSTELNRDAPKFSHPSVKGCQIGFVVYPGLVHVVKYLLGRQKNGMISGHEDNTHREIDGPRIRDSRKSS